MPAGRYLRGLNAYDLLGNIVPGVTALVVTMGFLSSPPIPNNIGGFGLFLVAAFSVGTVIQAYASKAVGERNSFDKTMDGVENLPSLQYTADDNSEGDKNGQQNRQKTQSDSSDISYNELFWRVFHPFIGPICGWWRPKRGKKLDDVILANRIWGHLIDTHEIQFETDSYGVLYHVMSSKVDDVSSPSRASRMQAIRNFNRGMWLTSWYSLILFAVSITANNCFTVGEPMPIVNLEYLLPTYFEYWPSLWHLGIVAAIGVVVFWVLSESTEEDYIEYLFADYAVSIGSEDNINKISFSEESTLSISGNLSGVFENSHTLVPERDIEDTDDKHKSNSN